MKRPPPHLHGGFLHAARHEVFFPELFLPELFLPELFSPELSLPELIRSRSSIRDRADKELEQEKELNQS